MEAHNKTVKERVCARGEGHEQKSERGGGGGVKPETASSTSSELNRQNHTHAGKHTHTHTHTHTEVKGLRHMFGVMLTRPNHNEETGPGLVVEILSSTSTRTHMRTPHLGDKAPSRASSSSSSPLLSGSDALRVCRRSRWWLCSCRLLGCRSCGVCMPCTGSDVDAGTSAPLDALPACTRTATMIVALCVCVCVCVSVCASTCALSLSLPPPSVCVHVHVHPIPTPALCDSRLLTRDGGERATERVR